MVGKLTIPLIDARLRPFWSNGTTTTSELSDRSFLVGFCREDRPRERVERLKGKWGEMVWYSST